MKSQTGGGKVGRYTALPMPQMIGVVAMKDVPPPPPNRSRDKYEPIWARVLACPAGQAAMVKFTAERQAVAVRAKFRKRAKSEGRFLSSSHSADRLTWYFWLEPKGAK